MLANPGHWQKYYHGDARTRCACSATSATPTASATTGPSPGRRAAVDRLIARLDGRRIPETLVSQYLGALYPAVAAGRDRAPSPSPC